VEKGKSSVSNQLKWRGDADVFILQVEQALKIRDRLLQVADDVSDVAEGAFWFHKKE
jgi:nitrogen regulatory protein PII